LSLPAIQATLTLPADQAAVSLQGQVNQALLQAGFPVGGKGSVGVVGARSLPQLDGPGGGGDSSSDDDDDEEEENEDDDVDDKDDEDEEPVEEEEAQDEVFNFAWKLNQQ
jgi:hypothetical protein